MGYTVKKLSELSGVTVRTLHFYEEIGLLKPAYYGANGYRYYEEKQLLELQQILFFKELGLTLKQIQKIVGKSDFDQLSALYSHKIALSKKWEKIGLLLKTLDKTIEHLKGKKIMKDKELFEGFNITLVKANHTPAEELVFKSVKNPTHTEADVKKRGKPFYDAITKKAHALFEKLVACLEMGLDPTAEKVQNIIKEHHALTEQTLTATKEVYSALAELYQEHPDFQKQFEPFHPELASYLSQGMKKFAHQL